jgi:simple sugar transport system permease protein
MTQTQLVTPVKITSSARRSSVRDRINKLALIPIIVLALVVGTLLHPIFLSATNLMNILQQSSELSILVLAEAVILIAGKFDLSLESVVGIAPMVAAWLVTAHALGGSGFAVNPWLALLAVFVVGAIIGVVNGFLVVRMQLNAFIATLAMLILLRGITVGVSGGNTLYNLPEQLLWLGSSSILSIPTSIWVAVVLYIIAGLWLKYHRTGRAIYAVGGSRMAARAAGIRDGRIIWGVYILGALLAALAGLLLTGRLASVSTAQGQNDIFTVFAAAVIGRISLDGGRGTVVGAVSGVVLLGIISNILTLSNVSSFWISAVFGAIILLALIVARYTSGEKDES